MKDATFRVIHFPEIDRFVGVAWNYDEAILISTTDRSSYVEARTELEEMCNGRNIFLRWFDGDYKYDRNSGQII